MDKLEKHKIFYMFPNDFFFFEHKLQKIIIPLICKSCVTYSPILWNFNIMESLKIYILRGRYIKKKKKNNWIHNNKLNHIHLMDNYIQFKDNYNIIMNMI